MSRPRTLQVRGAARGAGRDVASSIAAGAGGPLTNSGRARGRVHERTATGRAAPGRHPKRSVKGLTRPSRSAGLARTSKPATPTSATDAGSWLCGPALLAGDRQPSCRYHARAPGLAPLPQRARRGQTEDRRRTMLKLLDNLDRWDARRSWTAGATPSWSTSAATGCGGAARAAHGSAAAGPAAGALPSPVDAAHAAELRSALLVALALSPAGAGQRARGPAGRARGGRRRPWTSRRAACARCRSRGASCAACWPHGGIRMSAPRDPLRDFRTFGALPAPPATRELSAEDGPRAARWVDARRSARGSRRRPRGARAACGAAAARFAWRPLARRRFCWCCWARRLVMRGELAPLDPRGAARHRATDRGAVHRAGRHRRRPALRPPRTVALRLVAVSEHALDCARPGTCCSSRSRAFPRGIPMKRLMIVLVFAAVAGASGGGRHAGRRRRPAPVVGARR